MRVGDWRLIFTIRTEERIIEIVAVRPRGEAYRPPADNPGRHLPNHGQGHAEFHRTDV
ncbi:type II toxin-antitoxin system RelE family toxin [Kyrpidia spormannii]|uniref:type II toxin-antitoxin system RelE family toxin n=1 Tax=Kyrpidia spormannii TaxID=2055160 RepID=UPI003322374E